MKQSKNAALEDYDLKERNLILEEYRKGDGRTIQEIIEDVSKQTMPYYLQLITHSSSQPLPLEQAPPK